jgi:hypothetical protein
VRGSWTQLVFFKVKRKSSKENRIHTAPCIMLLQQHGIFSALLPEVYEIQNSPLASPLLSTTLPAYASYLRLASRTASYPAVISTIARSDTISEPVPVMRHPRKTMHRFVVSHVNSICVCNQQLGSWRENMNGSWVRTFMLHCAGMSWSMPGIWPMWPWSMWE